MLIVLFLVFPSLYVLCSFLSFFYSLLSSSLSSEESPLISLGYWVILFKYILVMMMMIPLRLTFTSIQGVEYELGILLEPYMFAARAQKTQEFEVGLCLKVLHTLHFL